MDLPSVRAVPSVTAAQMADVDRAAIEEYGISIEMLMENASHQIAAACRVFLGGVAGRRIVCLAGSGNNGGDAIGAARRLSAWGAVVSCVLASAPEGLHRTARLQYDIARRIGIPFAEAAGFEAADLIVDGLLGYSTSGAPRGGVERLIVAADRSRVPLLAIDLPSGLDPDSGRPLGVAIRAAVTLALALPKRGLLEPGAGSLVGDLLLADIGIPPAAFDRFGLDARTAFAPGDLVFIRR